MPETTVSMTTYTDSSGTEREQYRTTVPKGLAEAFDLAEKTLEWEIENGTTLTVNIKDD